jgi:predicted regulator of Ras-like GTPase activity (Roadblock/LC7/MglB family)
MENDGRRVSRSRSRRTPKQDPPKAQADVAPPPPEPPPEVVPPLPQRQPGAHAPERRADDVRLVGRPTAASKSAPDRFVTASTKRSWHARLFNGNPWTGVDLRDDGAAPAVDLRDEPPVAPAAEEAVDGEPRGSPSIWLSPPPPPLLDITDPGDAVLHPAAPLRPLPLKGSDMSSLSEIIERFESEISGCVATSIVRLDDGLDLVADSIDPNIDTTISAAIFADVLRSIEAASSLLGGPEVLGETEDLLLSTSLYNVLLRWLGSDFYHLVMIDRMNRRSNIGMARVIMNKYEPLLMEGLKDLGVLV